MLSKFTLIYPFHKVHKRQYNTEGLGVAKLHHYADACVSSLSLIFNFLLLYMLMKRTTVEMRQYRKVLLMTCISDIALSSIVFIAQPVGY